jgi:hypothetical protein
MMDKTSEITKKKIKFADGTSPTNILERIIHITNGGFMIERNDDNFKLKPSGIDCSHMKYGLCKKCRIKYNKQCEKNNDCYDMLCDEDKVIKNMCQETYDDRIYGLSNIGLIHPSYYEYKELLIKSLNGVSGLGFKKGDLIYHERQFLKDIEITKDFKNKYLDTLKHNLDVMGMKYIMFGPFIVKTLEILTSCKI